MTNATQAEAAETTECTHACGEEATTRCPHGECCEDCSMTSCSYAGKRTKLVIEIEVLGDSDDAFAVVDSLLDAGFLQDAINDHDFEDAGKLKVCSAMVRAA